MLTQRITNLFFIFSLFILLPLSSVLAAEFDLQTSDNIITGGDLVVSVLFNSEDKSINTLGGQVVFDPVFLSLKDISDGDSIVNFWLEKPTLQNHDSVNFSGIIPGGYKGSAGLVFTLTFTPLKPFSTNLSLNNPVAYLNDGQGTPVVVKSAYLALSIQEDNGVQPIRQTEIIDHDQPEYFQAEYGQDANLFDGQWFLVFSTQDKISGLDHYEIQEGNQEFVKTDSPYLIRNQNLDQSITIKAIDKKGNTRLVTVQPKFPRTPFKKYSIWAIIILVAVLITFICLYVKFRRKNKK